LAALNILFATAAAFAQAPDAENATQRQQVVAEFNRRAPQVGERLPAIGLLDSSGNKFGLETLRGHYSVLVFGCLT